MSQHRQTATVTSFTLVVALTSLVLGISTAFCLSDLLVTMGLIYAMLECVVLHIISLATLAFVLPPYWKNPTPIKAVYLYVSVDSLLALLAFYTLGEVSGLPAAANGISQMIGLYGFILFPLPQIGLLTCCHSISQNLRRALAGLVALSALLPLVLQMLGRFDLTASLLTASAVTLVVLAVQAVLFVRNVLIRRVAAFNEIALGNILLVLGYPLMVLYCVLERDVSGLRILRYVLLFNMLCVSMTILRRELDMRRELSYMDELRLREEEYRIAVQHSGKCIVRYDMATRTSYYQAETAELFNLPLEKSDTPESNIADGIVVEQCVEAYRDFYRQMIEEKPSGSVVFACYNSEHVPVWQHADFTMVYDSSGKASHAIVSAYELPGMHEREAAYQNWKETYAALPPKQTTYFETNLTDDCVLSQNGELLSALPLDQPCTLTAATQTIAQQTICGEDQAAFLELLDRKRLLACHAQDIRFESLKCQRIQGEERCATLVSVQMVSDPYSSDVRAFIILRDIEEEQRRKAHEKKLAMTDELTGLLMRTSFIEKFNECIHHSQKDARQALIMIDLDGFKLVNDNFGHRFGDSALVDVAEDLHTILRSDDLIGRFGGDEFMICLRAIPQEHAFLEQRCHAICQALTKKFSDDITMTASLGVALYPDDGQSFDDLYQCADQALYHAKWLGRDRFAFYEYSFGKPQGQKSAEATLSALPKEREQAMSEHRYTLLVVDDQEMNRAILREIFKATYDVVEAAGGREALDILRGAQQISAMVLDLMMPDVSGLDVLKVMNGDPYYQTIPVIIVSGASEEEYSLKAIELGAMDFVTKPVDARLMCLRVHNAISRRETENLHAQNLELLMQRAGEARHQNQLRYLAEHDSLTGIYNKTAFYRKTVEMLKAMPTATFCLVNFDIQRFRAVNDIFGHEEGDKLLRFIALQLRDVIGSDGTYSRADTDHFIFCIPYEQEDLIARIQRLCEGVKNYKLSFEVQLCFGIFLVDERDMPINMMCDHAEMAKRTIKGSYLQHWAFYDATMRDTLLQEQAIIGRMSEALENGEFIAYYQPKCRLDTGAIIGAEALVRWNHPQRGILPPGEFVPVFEKNGFIMKIDVYMWELVCIFISKRLRKNPKDPIRVSVNMSRVNLYNPKLCKTLEELCKRYNVPVSRMHVEITESAYAENAHLLLEMTAELQEMGFLVEMDDFGSGYSSLNMLKETPVDVLKLDMRFLSGTGLDERGDSILSSIVGMATKLGMEVIAEGVETEEQARFLATIGCKMAQGYYYAKPMTEAEFEQRLDEHTNLGDHWHGSAEDAIGQVKHLLCSAALCELTQKGMELLEVNDYYMHMMHAQRESMDATDLQLERWIGTQDCLLLKKTLEEAKNTGMLCKCVYLQRDLSDKQHLLKCGVRYLSSHSQRNIYMLTFTDISGEQRQAAKI
ncbi:MAG: EAL domain-containing protein [Clostridia bacterium]